MLYLIADRGLRLGFYRAQVPIQNILGCLAMACRDRPHGLITQLGYRMKA
jgi:hypothetical protein